MPQNEEPNEIKALRDALSFSPENLALIKHLGETLMKYGRYESAEETLKEGLVLDPYNTELSLSLAQAYFEQGKNAEAFVILEELETRDVLNSQSYLLFARLLSHTTELVKAADYYKKAKALDPGLEDAELEKELEAFLIDYYENDPDDPRKALVIDQAGELDADLEKPTITFENVGGMDSVKDQIRMKIIHPLENAELFKAYGKSVGGGVLLYGPPGCGKTLIARATAGEVKANFLSIGLHEILSMWIGESEKNLHGIFDQARRSQPSVLFFDEADAIASKRTDMRQSAGKQLINTFLSELDGVEFSNEGVLILAATNAPWHLDSAFRRPGRFDRIVFVPPPDQGAREAILRLMLKDKPVENIDYATLAKKTHGFTGADLKAVVDIAIEAKLERSMKTGNLEKLNTKDLARSFKKVKPSSLDWFATAKNHALFANQSGLYDDILDYLKLKKS
ncbi:MAG: AAA family ATPase [Cyanothece sp. SIO1E1]|nr:AAA family ATPase [Cyanothece sp. SIO1E1]